jgi:hypothetical protein
MAKIAPPPTLDRIARAGSPGVRQGLDAKKGMLTEPWVDWFRHLTGAIDDAPQHLNTVTLTTQAASIGATDMSDGAIAAGLYRVTYYARITQAATTSSSLTVTLGWTDGGAGPGFSGAAMTGNTTTTVQSETFMLRTDARAAINYSTTYASVGATPMQYRLDIVLMRVPT